MELPWKQWAEYVAMAEFTMMTYRQITFPVATPKQGTQYIPLTIQVNLDEIIPDEVAEIPRKKLTEEQKRAFAEELSSMKVPESSHIPGIYPAPQGEES